MYRALRQSNIEQSDTLRTALGNTNITEEAAQEVRAIVSEIGVEQSVRSTAQEYVDTALTILQKSEWYDDSESFLTGLMDYIVKRLH